MLCSNQVLCRENQWRKEREREREAHTEGEPGGKKLPHVISLKPKELFYYYC